MDRFAGKPRSHRLIRGKSQATKKQPVGCFFLHRKLDLSQFFLDASCFTGQVTQVVQLGFTYVTATFNGHAVDLRAVGLESTLYANTIGDFTNGECTVYAAVTLGNNNTFERLQTRTVEGVVIAKRNRGVNSAFTVRKISNGVGVERTFQTYSPQIDSLAVKRRGDVRKAKLYYLRDLSGKAARIKEKLA